MAPSHGKQPKKRANTLFGHVSKKRPKKASVEKTKSEPDTKAENAERNAIYDLTGDDDRALKAAPKVAPKTGSKSKAPKTKAPKTGSKSKAPKTKAPKAGPKTGPKSKAPYTGPFNHAPYTGPFSDAPYTRPELGERSPSGSPPPSPRSPQVGYVPAWGGYSTRPGGYQPV
jgi:hypothetical protein